MNGRPKRFLTVGLVAIALVATVLTVGCGSVTTTTQAPATSSTTAKTASTTAKASTTTAKSASATAGAAAGGKALFTQYCVSCHAKGVGTFSASQSAQLQDLIKTGSGGMPGFADKLSAADITAITAYLASTK